MNQLCRGLLRTIPVLLALAGAGPALARDAAGDQPTPPVTPPQTIPVGYHLQTIQPPKDVALEATALAFRGPDDLLVGTRYGEVWNYKDGQWSLFADGMQTVLGLWVDADDGRIFAAQKPELTELVDEDEDNRVDLYRSVCSGWGMNDNYHEFVFGPVRDSAGNFYMTINLAAGGPGTVRNSVMARPINYRGWMVKISPDGEMTPFANGFRSPAGINIDPDGELWVTDNQGDWVPTSTLFHVQQGKFYGHPASLADDPRFKGRDLNEVPIKEFSKIRTRPAVWFPQNILANSPGNPVWDTTDGKFGPFDGQIFVGDQTHSNIMRVSLEKVGGKQQGVVFDFVDHTQCGIVRSAFAPDGSLWMGQTNRGWGSEGDAPFGVQRLVYDGKTIPFAIKTIRITPDGFDLHYTRPVDPKTADDPASYKITHWDYLYHPDYGSDPQHVTEVTPRRAEVSDDGKTVHLILGDQDMQAKKVYQIQAPGVDSSKGEHPATDTGFYAVNELK